MSTVSDALDIARTFVNDDAALTWSDAILMPKVALAHGELLAKLILNGISVVHKVTSPRITVTAGSTDLGNNMPTDIGKIIKMDELAVNDDIANAIPMTKVEFIPNYDKTETLRYWAYIQQKIALLGATTDRQVCLYYEKTVPAPTKLTDVLFFNQSEIFIGPRVAALMLVNTPNFQTAQGAADANLSLVVRAQVKSGQNLPVRRRPFSWALRARRGNYL